ncbi:MAG: hypothetical protein AAFX08_04155 [Pseudomonadota bacterium]
MTVDVKDIAETHFRNLTPKDRLSERQRSEAAALKELEAERDARRRKSELLRKARLAAEKK